MEKNLALIITENHKFLFMVSFCAFAAMLMLRDGMRALKDSNEKEPLILFSFSNSSNNPVKGWVFIIFSCIILSALVIKLILHFYY